jgi:hypothetical protein
MPSRQTPFKDTEQKPNKQEHFELAFLGGHGRTAPAADLPVLVGVFEAPARQDSR